MSLEWKQAIIDPLLKEKPNMLFLCISNFSTEPLPLAGVFELVKTENDKIEIQPIQRLERFTYILLSYLS